MYQSCCLLGFLSCQITFVALQKSAGTVLHNLRHLHEDPPSLHVSMSAEVQNSICDISMPGIGHSLTGGLVDADLSMGGIDWNISVDDTQIDWDIGTDERVEESGNGFGSYEIIDYDVDLKEYENDKPLLDAEASSKKEDQVVVSETSGSEICLDISLESSQVSVVEDAAVPDAGTQFQLNPTEKSQHQSLDGERSQLLETDYRNNLLDDLFEVINILPDMFSVHITLVIRLHV